jgi:single-stranded-DNA-specific exonuclease
MSMDPANLNAFRRGLSRFVEKALGGAAPRPTLTIDGSLSLADLSLELVADLERLAPFGPGNPPLVLSLPRLSIQAYSTIGRESDHLQITVKDAFERTHRVIWWRGAGWPLPEGVFDLACVVRASNYRGQRDVQVEWIDARPIEAPKIDLRRRINIIDQRDQDHPLPVLQNLLQETQAVVWAEGEAKDRLLALGLPARDRSQLTATGTLIIWSPPPGRSELHAALDAASPDCVVLFAVPPVENSTEAFLRRVAGLSKFALERQNGQASLNRLAAASGQRVAAVRLALRWMAQRGMIQVEAVDEEHVRLENVSNPSQPQAEETLSQLRTLFAETCAYREYFRTADKDNLF